MILVYRYRVKSLNGLLNQQSRAVNFVWNFCNDRQKDALRFGRRWHTGFDLNKLTTGASKELGLHSGTINAVCEQYAKSRSQKNRPYLRYRGKKSLGWVPFKGRDLKREGDAFRFAGNTFRVFNSRALPKGKIKDGSNFSRDSRGHWYLNIVIDVQTVAGEVRAPLKGVGIDLGLKDFATLSTGEKIGAQRIYRGAEAALAVAQRAGKKKRVKAIHAQIGNRRNDFHHKLSTRIVREFAAALPAIRELLDSDVEAAYRGDPAAGSVDEVVLCYPGIHAVIHHRLAHQLYRLGVPLIALLELAGDGIAQLVIEQKKSLGIA